MLQAVLNPALHRAVPLPSVLLQQIQTYITRAKQITLMGLFVKNIAAADSYLAVDDAKLCTEFIREQLATFV